MKIKNIRNEFVYVTITCALLITCLVISGCDNEQVIDEGMMVDEDGNIIPPCVTPWQFRIDESVTDPEFGFDPTLIDEMSEWWNEQGGVVWLLGNNDCEFEELPCITVQSGFTGTPPDEDNEALGVFQYEIQDGCVTTGTIIISSDITYNQMTTRWALYHEGGHTLSLLDDPYSLDLNSIMSERLLTYSRATRQDIALLHENLIVFER